MPLPAPKRQRAPVVVHDEPPRPSSGLRVLAFGVAVPGEVGDAEARVFRARDRMPTAAELRAGLADKARVVVLAGGAAARRLPSWLRQPGVLAAIDAVLLVHPDLPPEQLGGWLEVAADAERTGGPLLAFWFAYHDESPLQSYPHALGLLAALVEGGERPARAASIDTAGFVWPAGEILAGPGDVAWTDGPDVSAEARGNVVVLVDQSERPLPAHYALSYAPGALVRAVLAPRLRLDVPRHPRSAPSSPHAAAIVGLTEGGGRLVVAAARQGTEVARELGSFAKEARKLWQQVRPRLATDRPVKQAPGQAVEQARGRPHKPRQGHSGQRRGMGGG